MSIRSRLRIGGRLRSLGRRIWPPGPKPLIIMYHRIANEPIDPWGNSVSPVHFEEHLRVIRRIRRAFPLAEFVKQHMAGTLRHDAVALTFDDGYIDNLLSGKPRLAAADVPATVFLSTGYLDRPGEFWWDELARLILLEDGPRSFDLIMRGEPMHFEFAVESQQFRGHSKNGVPSTTQQAILTAIWEAMRLLEDGERESAMAELRSIFSVCGSRVDRGRAMTREEVGRLVTGGLITIGAHTVTHPVLPELEADASNREIIESKRACEALIEGPVAGFAYPYGALDAKSRAAVISAGFNFACSVRYGPTVATSDVFALPRIHVRDWDGDVFERAIRSASAV
jgi:peptidoglycan/xylan/chitin deacetylase (PgdA/CDA1 family)